MFPGRDSQKFASGFANEADVDNLADKEVNIRVRLYFTLVEATELNIRIV